MTHLRRLLPYARPYWRIFAAGFACVLISNYFTTLGPQFLQQGIDALGATADPAALQRAIPANTQSIASGMRPLSQVLSRHVIRKPRATVR